MSMKKLSSEYDQISNIKENNNPIAEIKKIKAEQFSPNRELKRSPFEAKSNSVPEYYNDHLGKNIEEVYKKRTESYEERQKKLQENRNRELNNNADTGSNISNDVSTPTTEGNMSEGLGEVEVGAEGATSVTSTAVSSSATVVSSASLTGVTVISACAVVAVTVGTGIMNTPPTLENVNYESGTDYLIYEYDINDFQEGQSYKLVVTCGNTVVLQKEITEEGHHKELLTGLLPDKSYEFQILGSNGELADIEYYTFKCYTTKLLEPEAVFMFDSRIDYEEGIFDIVYDIYISDYYHSGSDTYLELYSGENLILTESVLDEEGFFRGALTNLPDGYEVGAIVYTTYYDKVIEIGRFGYVADYPDDFNGNENKQIATFDFTEESFANTFNKETGMQELVINTNFDNTNDTRESYRIDLYDLENNLIDTKISSEKEVSFSVPAYYKKVKAVLTPIKEVGPKNSDTIKAKKNLTKEFEPIVIEYEFNPPLFSDEAIEFFNNGYNFSLSANQDLFTDAILSVGFIQNNIDGTKNEHYYELEDSEFRQNVLTSIDGSILLADVSSIDVEIYLGEYVIGKYTYIIPENAPTEELDNGFVSTYSLTKESITQEYNNGNNYDVTIDTKFVQKVENESYKLEIYNSDTLIDSIEKTTDAINTFNIPAYYKNIKVVLTPLKEMVDGTKEFETTEVTYSFEPELIINEKINYYNNGYIINLEPNSQAFNEDDIFTVEITENYKDDTIDSRRLTYEFNTKLNKDILTSNDKSILLKDIKNIDVVIKLDDAVIGKYNYDLSNVEATDDLPYLSTYTFNEDSITASFDKETGVNTITIDTDFTKKSEYEEYRIDILYNDEIIETSNTTTDSSIEIQIDSYYDNVVIRFTEIKGELDGTSTEVEYTTPLLFNDLSKAITYYKDGYILELSANNELFDSNDTFSVQIIETYNDDTTNEANTFEFSESITKEIMTSLDGTKLLSDIKSIEIIISLNDIVLDKYTYDTTLVEATEALSYKSTYTFNEDAITTSFDKETGINTITINTGFNQANEYEKYRIDILYDDEIIETSNVTTDSSVEIQIASYYDIIGIRFTEIKGDLDLEATTLENFEASNLFIDTIDFRKNGYILNIDANEEIFTDDTLKVTVNQNNSNGTTSTFTFDLNLSLNEEIYTSEDASILLEDVDNIEVIISLNDITYGKFSYNKPEPIPSASLDDKFFSTYTFNEDSITVEFDAENLEYKVIIITDFDNTDHDNEKYKIEIIDNTGALVDPIATTTSTAATETLTIPAIYKNIKVKLIPLKDMADDTTIDFTSEEVEVISPALFNDLSKAITYFTDGYTLDLLANSTYLDSNDTFNVQIIETYNNDSTNEANTFEFSESITKEIMTSLDGTKLLSDIKSIEIIISLNDIVLDKYTYDTTLVEATEALSYKSTYTFNEDVISTSFDKETGINTITINTGFNQANEYEKYRIDILYDDEVIETSDVTTDSSIEIQIDSYYDNVVIRFTEIKGELDGTSIEVEYTTPLLFNDLSKAITYYKDGYILELSANNELFDSNDTFSVQIIETYNDDTTNEANTFEFSESITKEIMTSLDGTKLLSDIKSIEIIISLNDIVLDKYTYDTTLVEATEALSYKSTYTFNEDAITTSFDKETGINTITINTGFNQANEYEKYRIDILYDDEVIVTSEATVEESIDLEIAAYYDNVTIRFTEIKGELDGSSTNVEYTMPTLFTGKNIDYYTNGYVVSLTADKEYFTTDDSFTIRIKEIYKDSDIVREPRELDYDFTYSLEQEVMTNGLLSEISSLEITILYNEIEIYKTIEDLTKVEATDSMPYLSDYSFELTNISNEYDLENGKNTITINTGFKQNSDLESYKIVIYDKDEDKEIKVSDVTTATSVTLELYLFQKNFTVKLIKIKGDYEFDSEDLDYESTPVLFTTTVNWYSNGYVLNIIPNEEYFNADSSIVLHINEVYTNGDEYEQGGSVEGEYHQQYMLTSDGETPIDSLAKLEISIYDGDSITYESYEFVYKGVNEGSLPYESEVTLSEDNITKTYDKENDKTKITINTGFVQSSDLDKYRVDILDGENVIATSNATTEEIVELLISSSYEKVNIKLTPIKGLLEITDGIQTIEDYDLSIVLFTNPDGVRYFDTGFALEILADSKVFDANEDALTATITLRFNDETVETLEDFTFEDLILSAEVDFTEYEKTISDFASFDVDISLDGSIIHTFYFTYEALPITIDQTSIAVDDDGNISFDYSVTLPDGATLNSITGMFDGANDDIELTEASGTITLTKLTASTLIPNLYINYTDKDGNVVEMPLSYTGEIDLGLELTTSSYISYSNSELGVNLKFDVTKDGKAVNANIELAYQKTEYNPDTEEQEVIYTDSEAYSTYEGKYFKFTPISTYNPSRYYLTYKITNGFDDEEKTIEITPSIIEEYASSGTELFNYNSSVQGYSDSKYINYVKTTNADGTVNYYFDTGFSDDSSNHNERIQYSYTVDSKTIFKYTEFFTGSYYALENVEDKNYDFRYMIFYNYTTDGLSYCTVDANAELLESNNAISLDSSSIKEEVIDDVSYSIINFTLDTTSLDPTGAINITYSGTTHTINIPLNVDNEINISDDGYTGTTASGLEYTITSDSNNNLVFNLKVEGAPTIPLNDNLPSVSFSFVPYIVAKIGSNNILNYESLFETASIEIGKYSATYDLDSFDMESQYISENSYDYGNNIVYIDIPEFNNSNDYRDKFKIIAYYNDEAVAEAYGDSSSAYVATSIAYETITYKIVFVKKVNDDYSNPIYQDYTEEQFLAEWTFAHFDGLQNVSVSFSENSYSIDAAIIDGYKANESNKFTANVIEYYTDGTNSEEITLDDGIGTDAPITLSNENDKEIASVKLIIYMNSLDNMVIYEKTFVNPSITVDDYTYNDGDDYISLPYSIDLPAGATITEGTIEYNGISTEIGEASGNYIISELQNSSIYLTFNIQYKVDGITYSVSKNIEKKLESVLDFDYTLTSYTSSSYKYAVVYNCYPPYYYDTSSETFYYYDNDIGAYINSTTKEQTNYHYDYDQQKLMDGDDNVLEYSQYTTLNNNVYVVKGSLYENVGCFKLLYTDSNCEINVTTAGGNIVNPTTGAELAQSDQGMANELNTYTISSPSSTLSFTMLHSLVDYYFYNYDVYGLNECQLEFNVTYDGETLLTKTISYNEPRGDEIPSVTTLLDGSFSTATANAAVTKNDDETVNVTIDTGFDNTEYPNYAYKLYVYNDTNFYDYENGDLVYESGYQTDSSVTLSNVINSNLIVIMRLYYYDSENGIYSSSVGSKTLGYVNSPFAEENGWDYNYSPRSYTNILYLNNDFIDTGYLDGTKKLQVRLKGTDYEIDLSSTESQALSGYITVTVTNENGITQVNITSTSDSDYVRGTVTINQGNSTIGYTEITYQI